MSQEAFYLRWVESTLQKEEEEKVG